MRLHAVQQIADAFSPTQADGVQFEGGGKGSGRGGSGDPSKGRKDGKHDLNAVVRSRQHAAVYAVFTVAVYLDAGT